MRSLKYLNIKTCNLYGRKFRVCVELEPNYNHIYTIVKAPYPNHVKLVSIEWFYRGEKRLHYNWDDVIKNIRGGMWILL